MQLPGGEPFQLLQLGAPAAFAVGGVTPLEAGNIEGAVVLRTETVYGTQVVAMSPKVATQLKDMLDEVVKSIHGGIEIVREIPGGLNGKP